MPQEADDLWDILEGANDFEFTGFSRHDISLLRSFLTNSGLTLNSLPIGDAVEAIKRSMEEHFRAAIPKTSVSSLDLATSIFQNVDSIYSAPRRGLPYTECLRTANLFFTPHYLAGQDAALFDPCPNFDKLCTFDTISSAVTAQIVTACGLDPATCTHTTLEELDPFIVCLKCPTAVDSKEFRPTMRWTQGVRRILQNDDYNSC